LRSRDTGSSASLPAAPAGAEFRIQPEPEHARRAPQNEEIMAIFTLTSGTGFDLAARGMHVIGVTPERFWRPCRRSPP